MGPGSSSGTTRSSIANWKSTGSARGPYGCQSAEIYDNTFSAEGLKIGRPQGFIFIAGGVAMVFNNTVTGTTYNTRTIQVSHERSFWPHWRVWDV